jgi:hypothetical protein
VDLADKLKFKKQIDNDNIDSSTCFNENFEKNNTEFVESKIFKDSLPMVKFYESTKINLIKAEKFSKKLAKESLILGSND